MNHWDQFVYNNLGDPYYTNLSTEIERTLKMDMTYVPRRNLEINMGLQVKSIPFNISQWAQEDTAFIYDTGVDPPQPVEIFQTYDEFDRSFDETTMKGAAFAHIKWRLFPRLSATLGLRGDYFDYTRKSSRLHCRHIPP